MQQQASSRNGIPSEARLSVYSTSFVPNWMLQVANDGPPNMFMLFDDSLRADKDPATLCLQELFPNNLFHGLLKERSTYENNAYTQHVSTRSGGLTTVPSLSPETYAARLMPLLMTEYNAITANLAGATLYNVNITPLPKASSPDPHTGQYFQFEAKSIREGWPPVTIGDKVILKPLNWSQQRAEGVCLEARIWALQKLAGLIVLRCDKLIYVPGMTFVVQWKVQDRFFAAAHSAIAACDRALSAASPSNPIAPTSVDLNGTPKTHSPSHSSPLPRVQYDMALARSWLFPEKQDLDPTLVDWPPVGSFNWHDPDLNPEQRQAVRSIVFGHRRVPYLVSGPPGTGKTKLLTESILQLLKHNSQAHLLVCGASNPSADTLTRRLAAAGLDHHTLFRLNHSSRPLDEVRGDISMFCRLSTEHGQFEMPSLRELLAYRVVVTSAADASLLYEYHACNSSLQGLSHHVSSAVHPLSTQPTPPHWTHMLLDEAAQAHEPDSLIPLSVVLPISQPNTKAPSFVPQIVFCGDVQQLGPRIWSEEARSRDLDNSLLGRLFLRDVYATHPEARRHLRPEAKKTLTRKKQTNSKKQSTTQTADVPFVNLIRNYRSHTAILAAPSVMFYEDTLVPCVSPAVFSSTLPLWQGQVRPGFPVSFWNVDSPETMVDDGASWANWAEIDRVCNIIHTLLSHCAGKAGQMPSLTPRDISVISPFRENVWQIRRKLRDMSLYDVDVGDVEALQGAENRVVILSTVRSRRQFLENDRQRSRGLVMEPRRLCVSLTRAKELLIVIGNAKLLCDHDPWWRTFLQYCIRQGCYDGPQLDGLEAKNAEGISSLELQLKNTATNGPDGFTALASGVASIGMRDED